MNDEIIEGNKLIADFLEISQVEFLKDSEKEIYKDEPLYVIEELNVKYNLKEINFYKVEDLLFHRDWNWLIKVIQEITKKLDLVFIRFNFFNGEIAITYRESLNSNNIYDIAYISKDEETFKLGVFTEIVEFIKFYNERKLVNK